MRTTIRYADIVLREPDKVSRPTDDRDYIEALARGLAVIESFDEAHPAMSLSDIAARTGLSRGAVGRILHTLELLGYVLGADRLFRLQPRALKLGYAYLSSQPLWRLAHPMLETAARDIGEACSLSILDDQEIVYITWIVKTRVVYDFVGVGGRLPAFCASMGRVLLAALPDPALDAFLARAKLVQRNPATIIDRNKLRAIIRKARRDGYATQDEEVEIGQRAVAVPVRDASGATIAAINVTVPAHRYTMAAMIDKAVPVLRREAIRLGEALSLVPTTRSIRLRPTSGTGSGINRTNR
jgi:IclR family pca regulon transcriptional regulator